MAGSCSHAPPPSPQSKKKGSRGRRLGIPRATERDARPVPPRRTRSRHRTPPAFHPSGLPATPVRGSTPERKGATLSGWVPVEAVLDLHDDLPAWRRCFETVDAQWFGLRIRYTAHRGIRRHKSTTGVLSTQRTASTGHRMRSTSVCTMTGSGAGARGRQFFPTEVKAARRMARPKTRNIDDSVVPQPVKAFAPPVLKRSTLPATTFAL